MAESFVDEIIPLSIQRAQAAKPVALDPNHVTRQEATRLAAEESGIVWPKTILPEGTALYESGTAKLKADRARWRKLPFANTALEVVTEALKAEDRQDRVVVVGDLKVNPKNGRLYTGNATAAAAGYTTHAFRQLMAQVPGCGSDAPRGFASTMLYLRPDEMAGLLNARLPAASTKKVLLRTKLDHGGRRVVRAALTESYANVSELDVAAAIKNAMGRDLGTAKLDYKPGDEKSQFEVIYPSEVPVETFRVGDVHYGCVIISNSETGQGYIRIRSALLRAACANLTLSCGEGVEVKILHMGNTERVKVQMQAAIRQAVAQIEPLAHAISASAHEYLSDVSDKSPGEILAQLAKKAGLSSERAEAWTKTYAKSYASSPTTWGLTSAITEAAQSASWWGMQQEEDEVAAKVINVTLRRALSA